jgi:hypothetical protein
MRTENSGVGRVGALVGAIVATTLAILFFALALFSASAHAAEAMPVSTMLRSPAALAQLAALRSGRPLAYLAILGSGYTQPGFVNAAITSPLSIAEIDVDTIKAKTAAGNLVVKDSSGNTLATITDAGTTGNLNASGGMTVAGAGAFSGYFSATNGFTWSNGLATILEGGTTPNGIAINAGASQAASDGEVVINGGSGATVLDVGDGSHSFVKVNDDGTTGSLWADTIRPLTANGNLVLKDQAGNTLATFTDAGTTGSLTVTGTVKIAAGQGFVNASGDSYFISNGGFGSHVRGSPVSVEDDSGNAIATFFDDGTTGSVLISGSKTKGQVTLNGDGTTNSTVTVNAGAVCMVQDETALTAEPAHSVTSTTLTIVNNVTNKGHVIDYHCF